MANSVPSNKTELLLAIEDGFKKVYQLLVIITPEIAYEQTVEGHSKGTKMSAHNLLAYLVGWNELVLKWIKLDENKQPIDFPETGFEWDELGLLAQKFYIDYQPMPYSELLTHFLQVKEKLIKHVIATPNQQLYGIPWYNKWTEGRMIQLNTSSAYKNAYNRLSVWLASKNNSL